MDEGFGKLVSDGIIEGTDVPMEEAALQAAAMYSKQAKDRLNKVNTVMRYFARATAAAAVNKAEEIVNKQQHLDTLNKAAGKVIMGAESRQTAVRQCIKEMSEKGIPAFVDAAGRQWSPEAYVNMDVRTTCSNAAHEAQFSRMNDYDIDLLEVDSHAGARPKCALDQGRIFSKSGKNRKYPAWKTSSYGEPDGILGINCGHHVYPYIEGVSTQTYFPYDKEENDKLYKQKQEQRRLERDVRSAKREVSMLNSAGDKEGAKAAKDRVKRRTAAYNEYCEKTGLPRKADRLTVQGYRTKAAEEKKLLPTLDNSGRNGIMKSKGFDFLDGVLGSDKIPKEQSKSLDEIISVIPQKHLDVIGKTIKEVEIVPNIGACNYDPVTKKLTLAPDKMNGSIIHEFGHILADAYDIYNDKEFLDILADGLDLDNGFDVKSYYFEAQNLRLYWISNPKFINDYQGRIYVDDDGFDYTAPIKPEQLKEYISVAFDAYFNNPELLKSKDKRLFDYLERMMNNV